MSVTTKRAPHLQLWLSPRAVMQIPIHAKRTASLAYDSPRDHVRLTNALYRAKYQAMGE